MHIDFIDSSLRDGQQSLWGLRMRSFQATPVLPYLDRTGYRVVDATGAGMFTVLLRTFKDDPWASMDHLINGMPNSEKRAATRTISVGGMGFAPDSVVDLWIRLLARHGIGSFWIFDCAFDMPKMKRVTEVVRAAGAKPVPCSMYGLTAVHDNEFFASRAGEMASWDGVQTVEMEDAAGVLTPERARTLLPALNSATGDTPVELHVHSNTGMAPAVYIEAMNAGITIFHTCVQSMASGPSLPSTEIMLENIRVLGHSHSLDTSLLKPVSDHFLAAGIAAGGPAEGYEVGRPYEFSLAPYGHQLPGGMTGSLKSQLRQHGMEDRLQEVLEEIPSVRKDLGEPIMATPFSQFVGIQALLNIVTGERYKIVPDEVIQYTLGHYGPLEHAVESDVADKILGTDRAAAFIGWEQPQPTLRELRGRFGKGISDEELLLRILHSNEEVDAMLAQGPIRTDPRLASGSVVDNLRQLISEPRAVSSFAVSQPGVSVTLRKHASR